MGISNVGLGISLSVILDRCFRPSSRARSALEKEINMGLRDELEERVIKTGRDSMIPKIIQKERIREVAEGETKEE